MSRFQIFPVCWREIINQSKTGQPDSAVQQHNVHQRDYYESRTDQQNWRMLPDTTPYIENHVDRVVSFAGLSTEEEILDVGCGMGKFTLPLAARGYRVQGLDLSPVLLEQLTQRNNTSVQIPTHCADILMPPQAVKDRFDVVTGFFMLHHLIDLEASFEQVHGMLRRGGRVVFLDVNPLCFLYYLQIFLSPSMSWSAEKGILNLTREKINAGLENAGFQDVTIARYGILPPPLRNRFFGQALDDVFDGMRIFRPVSAFQLISAQRS